MNKKEIIGELKKLKFPYEVRKLNSRDKESLQDLYDRAIKLGYLKRSVN